MLRVITAPLIPDYPPKNYEDILNVYKEVHKKYKVDGFVQIRPLKGNQSSDYHIVYSLFGIVGHNAPCMLHNYLRSVSPEMILDYLQNRLDEYFHELFHALSYKPFTLSKELSIIDKFCRSRSKKGYRKGLRMITPLIPRDRLFSFIETENSIFVGDPAYPFVKINTQQ